MSKHKGERAASSAPTEDKKSRKKSYEKQMARLQVELAHLQAWVKKSGARISLFCDPDASEEQIAAAKATGTDRIELPSLSATNSTLPSDANPLGCANDANPGAYGWRGSNGPSTMSSRPLPAYGPISDSSSGIFQI